MFLPFVKYPVNTLVHPIKLILWYVHLIMIIGVQGEEICFKEICIFIFRFILSPSNFYIWVNQLMHTFMHVYLILILISRNSIFYIVHKISIVEYYYVANFFNTTNTTEAQGTRRDITIYTHFHCRRRSTEFEV